MRSASARKRFGVDGADVERDLVHASRLAGGRADGQHAHEDDDDAGAETHDQDPILPAIK